MNIATAFAAIMMMGFGADAAFAGPSGNTAQQTVTCEVTPVNELAVSAPTASLVVNSATAGSALNVVTDSSSSYSITTNGTARVITGMLNADMPEGVTLSITLEAPSGAVSRGKQVLRATPVILVSGIQLLSEAGKAITYELAATSAAGVVPSAIRTITLTIADGGG